MAILSRENQLCRCFKNKYLLVTITTLAEEEGGPQYYRVLVQRSSEIHLPRPGYLTNSEPPESVCQGHDKSRELPPFSQVHARNDRREKLPLGNG